MVKAFSRRHNKHSRYETIANHHTVSGVSSCLTQAQKPLLLVDLRIIKASIREWRHQTPSFRLLFKLNGLENSQVLKTLETEVNGFDATNRNEVRLLSKLQKDRSSRISVFSNPFLFKKDITACVEKGVDLIVTESPEEVFSVFRSISSATGSGTSILIRIPNKSASKTIKTAVELSVPLVGFSVSGLLDSSVDLILENYHFLTCHIITVHVDCFNSNHTPLSLEKFAEKLRNAVPDKAFHFIASQHELIFGRASVIATRIDSCCQPSAEAYSMSVGNAESGGECLFVPSECLLPTIFDPVEGIWYRESCDNDASAVLEVRGLQGPAGEEVFILPYMHSVNPMCLRGQWLFWRLSEDHCNPRWRNSLPLCLHYSWSTVVHSPHNMKIIKSERLDVEVEPESSELILGEAFLEAVA